METWLQYSKVTVLTRRYSFRAASPARQHMFLGHRWLCNPGHQWLCRVHLLKHTCAQPGTLHRRETKTQGNHIPNPGHPCSGSNLCAWAPVQAF